MNRQYRPRTFKSLRQLAVCLVWMCATVLPAMATHSAGCDIQYRCLGGLLYQVEVAFYRDCGGVSEPNSITINCKSLSANYNINLSAAKVNNTSNGTEVTLPCASATTTCLGGATPGIKKWIYRATVQLPSARADWVFSYAVCCRNCTITTINSPCAANSTLYVEAKLNNLTSICNNSPVFSNLPVAFVCLGQNFNYNHGVTDPDGDSLSYSLIAPKTSATNSVSFTPPSSFNNPVASSTPFTVNPQTGDINFTPSQLQVGVMAILVNEYRNGIQIGSVIRDMQVYTQTCSNALPALSGINGTNDFSIQACPGLPVCFTLFSTDADASQQLSISSNQAIPGASYTLVNGQRPSLQFCWIPSAADIRNTPRTFTVTVKDDACPANASQTYSYSIFVNGPQFNAVVQTAACNATNGSISINPSIGSAYTYIWQNGSTQAAAYQLPAGAYRVNITDPQSGCTIDTTFVVLSEPPPSLAIQSSPPTCGSTANGNITATVSGGTPPYTYTWSTGASTSSLQQLASGYYSLTVNDAHGCSADTAIALLQVASGLTLSAQTTAASCNGLSNGSAAVAINGGSGPFIISWSNGATGAQLNNVPAGIYTAAVTDQQGCTSFITATITEPSPVALSTEVITDPCGATMQNTVNATATGGSLPYTFTWSNGHQGPLHTNWSPGVYTCTLSDSHGCMATSAVEIHAGPAPLQATGSVKDVVCRGESSGKISLNVSGGAPSYNYVWNTGATAQELSKIPAGNYTVTITDGKQCTSQLDFIVREPDNMLMATANAQNPECIAGLKGSISLQVSGGASPYRYTWNHGDNNALADSLNPGEYTVTIEDAGGCNIQQTYHLKDSSVLLLQAEGSEQVCAGKTVTLFTDTLPTGTLQWYFNGTPLLGAQQPSFITPAPGTYTVLAQTVCGPLQSNPVTIQLRSLHNISINSPVIICQGESTPLHAGGGVEYAWSPSQGLDNPDISNPIARPDSTTTYTVTVKDAFGCTATASVEVTVLCDTMNIPNGFSPNDDGINDHFIIEGIESFPGNVLFVYNRWGNLVYKQKDYANQWDGRSNVNGVMQGDKLPMGTYYYILNLNNEQKPATGFVVIRH